MKYTSVIVIALIALLTSCSSENEVAIDFSGTYDAKINCTGALSDAEGEAIVVIIAKTGIIDSYTIDLGDEVIFSAIQIDNVLNIGAQTLNEGQEFDVISMEGEIRMVDLDMVFDFMHSVDDEGESTCSFPLVKR